MVDQALDTSMKMNNSFWKKPHKMLPTDPGHQELLSLHLVPLQRSLSEDRRHVSLRLGPISEKQNSDDLPPPLK